MLKWAFIFLLIAIVAGIFGFSDVEPAAATIAQWLFGIFLVLFVGALAIGLGWSQLMSRRRDVVSCAASRQKIRRPRSLTARCPG